MNKEVSNNIRLGMFVLAGAAVLIVGLYLIGSNRHMFSRTITLSAKFYNVSGLQTGNNVRYAGIDVGIVEDIVIVDNNTIQVIMSVKRELKDVIRKDSRASIGTDGLMGNKLINIDPGSPSSGLVADNDELPGIRAVNTEEMLQKLEGTNDDIAVIASNLRQITDNINTGRGTLYTVLNDTTLSAKIHKSMDNIEAASRNIVGISEDLGAVVGEVKTGKGLVGTLINDTSLSSTLTTALENVKTASNDISGSVAEVKEVLQKVNKGNGSLGTILNDTASAGHLKQALVNLETGTSGFSENMEALKHNFLFRGYFKKQEKKTKAVLKDK